jgi:ketosteroid isomerase-like protein
MSIDRRQALGVLAAGAAAPAAAATEDRKMSNPNVDLARRYIAAIAAFETDGLARFFGPGFVQVEMPNLMTPKGQSRDGAACIEGSKKGAAILSSQQFDIENVVAADDWVSLETKWVGVLKVGFGDVKPGTEMRAEIAMFLRVKDGRIVYQRNYDCYHPLA